MSKAVFLLALNPFVPFLSHGPGASKEENSLSVVATEGEKREKTNLVVVVVVFSIVLLLWIVWQ